MEKEAGGQVEEMMMEIKGKGETERERFTHKYTHRTGTLRDRQLSKVEILTEHMSISE